MGQSWNTNLGVLNPKKVSIQFDAKQLSFLQWHNSDACRLLITA
jgi:hypothetical protein